MKISRCTAAFLTALSASAPAAAAEKRVMSPADPALVEKYCEGKNYGMIPIDIKKTKDGISYTILSCFFHTVRTNGTCETASIMINGTRSEDYKGLQRNYENFSAFVRDNCPVF